MYEVRIPGSDALRDIADLVDQVHRLRLAITGTSTQPGLLAQVESARPVVDQLSDSLVELREQNLGAIELVQHLEAISRELLVEIPDRLLGTLQSQLFAERLTVALVDVVVAMAEVVSNTQLEIAAEQLSAKAGQDARQLIDEILARNEADSVLALDQQVREMEQRHEIEIERLIGQHQIALERAEAALDEAQGAAERMTKQRDQAENRLQHERRIQGRNSLQWGAIAFVTGIGLTLFLHQPAFAALGNLVKSL